MINVQFVGDALFAADHPKANKLTVGTNSNNNNLSTLPTVSMKVSPDSDAETVAPLGQADLVRQSYVVLNTLKTKDFAALAALVHPQKGLTLTPYSTVDPLKDQTLKAGELAKALHDEKLYVWGFHDGSGAPIKLRTTDYFEKFVYNADYSAAPTIGVNRVLSTGNSLENVVAAYPDAKFVEFYYPKLDPKNNGLDWCGLKLVFEQVLNEYKLIGLIHSEWTI